MRPTAVLFATLLLTAAAPLDGATAARPTATVGTYRAVRLDQRPLPAVERLPATTGYHHWVKLEQAVVTLRADGRFIASFRYWHHHLKDGAPVPSAPVMSETHRGTYVVRDGRVTFTPQQSKGKRAVEPIVGALDGSRLRVTYVVRSGATPRTLRLHLERDAGW